jgi:hypothetical protein
MPRLHETVDTRLPVDAAFPFIADFANNPIWDPGTASARRVDDGPVGVGSTYELDIKMPGRTMPMTYRITAYEPNTRVELRGEGDRVRARDDIRFTPTPSGGTHVDYVADLELTGWWRFLTPLLGGTFRKIGAQARDGMQRALDERAATSASLPGPVDR